MGVATLGTSSIQCFNLDLRFFNSIDKALIIMLCREPEGKAWVTYKKPGFPSTHGELTCHGLSVDHTPYITSSEGFSVDKVSKVTTLILLFHLVPVFHLQQSVSISYEDSVTKCSCTFQAPDVAFSSVHQAPVRLNEFPVASIHFLFHACRCPV